jgi:hypothetical protein
LLPLAIAVGTLLSLIAPSAASATPITVSLQNARSYCVNRQGGGNSSGTTVFLYACSGGNNNWNEINSPINNQNPACTFAQCFEIQDPNSGSLCFGINTSGNGTGGSLMSCYNTNATWEASGTLLDNIFWSQDGWLATPSDSNRSTLYVTCENCGAWHQWHGY